MPAHRFAAGRGWVAAAAALAVLASLMGPFSASAASPAWANTGPLGAPIYQLALSAGNPSTLYGTGGYVVWRSDDGGSSWTPTHPGFLYSLNRVENIAVSAQNPLVVYAGTSQALKKTTSGGRQWHKIMNGLPSYPDVEAVLVDPTDDQVAYVGGGSDVTLYKTTDGGSHWSPSHQGIGNQVVTFLAVDPAAPSVLYASTGSGGALVYKTTDGGAHWFGAGNDLPQYPGASVLVVDPSDDQTVFAAVGAGVYRSTDGGGHWIPLSAVAAASLRSLAASPTEPDTLYAGESDLYNPRPRGVFKSTDGGVTWQAVTHGFKGSTIAVDPTTPGHVYVGTGNYENDDLGVFETTDGGVHWLPRVQGMLGTFTRSLVVAPTDQRTAYAATHGDPGVYRTTDGGRSWRFAGAGLPLAPTALAVSPTDPNVVYAGLDQLEPSPPPGGVYKSVDGGRTWQPANQGIADRLVLSLVVDPTNEDVLYAGIYDFCGAECESGSLWKTTDGGATWFKADLDVFLTPVELAISASDPQTVYYLDSSFVVGTRDGGQNWAVAGTLPLGILQANDMAVDPGNAGTLYVAGYGGIAKSTDYGATWTMLTGLSDTFGLSIPLPGQLCAGTRDGVSCSPDGGGTWAPVAGLNGLVNRVAVGAGRLLYAGSYDHGVGVHQG